MTKEYSAQRTENQIKGLQFEIWCEKLFKWNGKLGVRRDVWYHRDKDYRQVDLEYFNPLNIDEHFVILELKYTSIAKLPLKFRDGGKKKKGGQLIPVIDNIVNELEERRLFAKSDSAILVTNSFFSDDLVKEVDNYKHIRLYDKTALERLDKRKFPWIGRRKPLDEQIKKIKWNRHQRKPHHEQV